MDPEPESDLPHPSMRPHLDTERLAALVPRWRVVVVDTSPSTHQALAADARAGSAPAGTVLVAEHQTAGRGRLDRIWTTPARAALTVSLVVEPSLADPDWPWLPLLLGTAVVSGVEAAGGPRCDLKWPNDVMAPREEASDPGTPDLKLGGLLAERVERHGAPAVAVLSLGLNVTTTAEELPVPTATSLVALGWTAPDRTTVLEQVLAAVAQRLEAWPGEGERLRAEYAERCVTVGRQVRVERPGAVPLNGEAVAISRDGSLVVDTVDGRRVVNAGDVVHVRAV